MAVPRTDSQAIAALILGIAGLVFCPLIPSVIAIIVGNQARMRIADDPTIRGDEIARAGVILGWVGVSIVLAGIVFAVAGFAFSFGWFHLR